MFLVDILTLCVLIVYMLTYCGISHLKCDETAEHLLYFSLTLKALCGHTVFVVVIFFSVCTSVFERCTQKKCVFSE